MYCIHWVLPSPQLHRKTGPKFDLTEEVNNRLQKHSNMQNIYKNVVEADFPPPLPKKRLHTEGHSERSLKHPKSAFFLYFAEKRKEYNGMKIGHQVFKTLYDKWRNSPEEEKSPYKETAYQNHRDWLTKKKTMMSEAEAKANVLINNDTYENGNKNNHSTVNNTASTNNSIAKPLKVKRTPNAYILFCEDNRGDILKENPKFGVVSVARRLGMMWNAQENELKETYREKAKQLSIASYTKAKEEAENNKSSVPDKEEEKSICLPTPKTNKVYKRPLTPYMQFVHENKDAFKKKYPELSTTELAVKYGESWQGLEKEDKDVYRNKFKTAQKEFKERQKEMDFAESIEGVEAKLNNDKQLIFDDQILAQSEERIDKLIGLLKVNQSREREKRGSYKKKPAEENGTGDTFANSTYNSQTTGGMGSYIDSRGWNAEYYLNLSTSHIFGC